MPQTSFGDLLKRWLGFASIAVGGFFLLVAVLIPFASEPEPDDRSAIFGCLILGLPPVVAGNLMVASSYSASRRQLAATQAAQQQLLRRTLYLLIENKQGRLTPMQFAIAADISVQEAEMFLNNQAKLLNADFDVTGSGNLVYLFPAS